MPSVSVIIPTFDRADHLVRAVRSCLAQTHAVLEVLVCEDGSTDAVAEGIRSLGDPRVRWVPGPHAGLPAVPRNRGLGLAKGEWIAFLDDDDTWMPQKLEQQFERLAASGARFSCTNAQRIGSDGGSLGMYFNSASEVLTFDDLLRVNGVICSSVLVHRDVLHRSGPFPEARELRALEDYALWLRCAAFTAIDRTDLPLVAYRDLAASSVRATGRPHAEQRALVLADLRASSTYGLLTTQRRRTVERHLRIARGHATFMDRLIMRMPWAR